MGGEPQILPAVISKVRRHDGDDGAGGDRGVGAAGHTEGQATYDVRYPDTNEIEMAVVQSRIRLPKKTR